VTLFMQGQKQQKKQQKMKIQQKKRTQKEETMHMNIGRRNSARVAPEASLASAASARSWLMSSGMSSHAPASPGRDKAQANTHQHMKQRKSHK
jgi:hypothetical protein